MTPPSPPRRRPSSGTFVWHPNGIENPAFAAAASWTASSRLVRCRKDRRPNEPRRPQERRAQLVAGFVEHQASLVFVEAVSQPRQIDATRPWSRPRPGAMNRQRTGRNFRGRGDMRQCWQISEVDTYRGRPKGFEHVQDSPSVLVVRRGDHCNPNLDGTRHVLTGVLAVVRVSGGGGGSGWGGGGGSVVPSLQYAPDADSWRTLVTGVGGGGGAGEGRRGGGEGGEGGGGFGEAPSPRTNASRRSALSAFCRSHNTPSTVLAHGSKITGVGFRRNLLASHWATVPRHGRPRC